MATRVADKRVYRSHDKRVGGVCAGLAERFDLDPLVVRILAVLISIMTCGIGVIAYIAMWALLPWKDDVVAVYEVTPESAESSSFGLVNCETGRASADSVETGIDGTSLLARLAIAVCLVFLFLLVSLNLAPLLSGTEWWQFWPVGLLIVGLCLIIIPVPNRHEMAWHSLGICVTSVSAMLLPMSLGLLSWDSVTNALGSAWPLVVISIVLFSIGMARGIDVLTVVGAFFFVAFCVVALTACAVPGEVEKLLVYMPDGREIKITFVGG